MQLTIFHSVHFYYTKGKGGMQDRGDGLTMEINRIVEGERLLYNHLYK